MSRIWSGILSSQNFGMTSFYAVSGIPNESVTGQVGPIAVYSWSNQGFGFAYSKPTTMPNYSNSGQSFLDFSPSLSKITVATDTSPYIHVYNWLPGFGTKYANPATLPGYLSRGVRFSTQENSIAISIDGPPNIVAYPWSPSGFGTKYADPASQPFSPNAIDFSPNGNTVLVADTISPFIHAYVWSNITGFGTKYADPATLPTNITVTAKFSPSGNDIVCCVSGDITNSLIAYQWSSGFGTKYADPAIPTPGGGNDLGGARFSSSGNNVAITTGGSIHAFPWSSGFGTKYANPVSIPANFVAGDIHFHKQTGGTENAIGVLNINSGLRIAGLMAWSWSSGFGTKYADPVQFETIIPNARQLNFASI